MITTIVRSSRAGEPPSRWSDPGDCHGTGEPFVDLRTAQAFPPHGRIRPRRTRARRHAGFSLIEVLMVVVLGSMVMGAAISAFLLIGRNSVSTSDYVKFDEEARRGLELFGRDVRMAENVSGFSADGVTLTVRSSASSTYDVTYAYSSGTHAFYRTFEAEEPVVLIRNIQDFELKRYELTKGVAKNDLGTKQLQLQLRAVHSGGARALATNNVVSARYILRNKSVSH